MKPNAPVFSIPVVVEFEDVDLYKIAHHTKLVSYLERCRVRYFSELGFNLHSHDMVLVLYHLEVNFKRPAFFQDNLRVIEENAFVELVRWRGMADVFQTHVTTRHRRAMPLLRYNTGDIVRRLPTGFRILGRERDLYVRPDGALVAASDIDGALPAGFTCWHYCLVQTGETRWDFHYVADHNAPGEVAEAVARVLGDDVRVNLFRRKFLQPAASGKFSLLKPLSK